jgi:hypothetical protein
MEISKWKEIYLIFDVFPLMMEMESERLYFSRDALYPVCGVRIQREFQLQEGPFILRTDVSTVVLVPLFVSMVAWR